MINERYPALKTADIDKTIDWENGDEPTGQSWFGHTVVQIDGTTERPLPGQFQLLNAAWGHDNFQIPSMVFMPEKQRLFLIAQYGYRPGKTAGTYSDDYGATWSEPQVLRDGAGRELNLSMAVGLSYLGQGRLTFGIEFTADNKPTRWYSDDYGATWTRSAPIPLAASGQPMYFWDPMLIDRDEQGEIKRVLEARYWETGLRTFHEGTGAYSQAGLWHSEDLGLTWSRERTVPQWLGVNEVAMIRAANGDIIAGCRTDNAERFIGQLDFFSGLAISISKDNGETWSELNHLYEFGRHQQSLTLMPNGDIVMTYAVRQGYENTPEGYQQFGIEALISTDNGVSWNLDRRYVLATWRSKFIGKFDWLGFAQSTSTALLPDGSLLTAFGTGMRNRGPENRCIMDTGLVRWRPFGD